MRLLLVGVGLEETLESVLRNGFDASAAATAEDAFRLFVLRVPDVVVVPFRSAEADTPLLRALTAPQAPTQGRVVALIMCDEEALSDAALQAGADDLWFGELRPAAVRARTRVLERRRCDQVSHERELRQLDAIIRTQAHIARAALDETEVGRLLVERAMNLTSADGGLLGFVDGDCILYGSTAGILMPQQSQRLQTKQTVAGRAVLSGRAVRCDVMDEPELDHTAVEELGVRSMLAVPLRVEGVCRGVLAVVSRVPRAFSASDETALEIMAGITGAALGISRDMKERLELQQRLALAERIASLGTLSAGVAHEINNPLSWVLSGTNWLQERLTQSGGQLDESDTEEALTALREVQDGAQRVAHIVRDLKAFTRTNDKEIAASLTDVIEGALRMSAGQLQGRARVTTDYGEVPLVQGNPIKLGQVFLNLMMNAAWAVGEGGPEKHEISVRTRQASEGFVLVEVTDTGVGITPEVQRRIFDPFFTTREVGQGTGLGLSICHSIVTEAGGEISVLSEPGKGTTFRVLLRTAPSPSLNQVRPAALPPCSDVRGRILVVDDEPLMCATIRRTLGQEHDVVAVTTARQALEQLDSGEPFDLVLSDLMMPEMTGMDLHAALATKAPQTVRRLVFMTGGAFTDSARAFLEQVPNVRIDKPFDPTMLRELVRELLTSMRPAPALN